MEVKLSTLFSGMDELAHTHHGEILKVVLAALEKSNPFAWQGKERRLTLDVDAVARAVIGAKKPSWTDREVVTPQPGGTPRASTTHMTPTELDDSHKLLHEIQRQIQLHFEHLADTCNLSAHELANAVLGNLEKVSPFDGITGISNELTRPIEAKRKRLAFTRSKRGSGGPAGGSATQDPLMRWHKLTLSMKVPHDVEARIAQAITNLLKDRLPTTDHEELEERLQEQLASPESDIAKLADVIAKETIGQVGKEAALRYLSFLEEQMSEHNQVRPYLHSLLRRLRLLQAYLPKFRPN